MTDEELLEYISESSTMSKAMDEYDGGSPTPSPYQSLLKRQCAHMTLVKRCLPLGPIVNASCSAERGCLQ